MEHQTQLDFFESEIEKFNSVFGLYSSLYTDDEVIKSMNGISPYSFQLMQASLEVMMLLIISKLSDKKENGTYENLSIERLYDIAKKEKWSNMAQIRSLIDRFKRSANSFREIKGKQEGHTNIDYVLGEEKLNDVFYDDIKNCLELLIELKGTFTVEKKFYPLDDHKKLVNYLKTNNEINE